MPVINQKALDMIKDEYVREKVTEDVRKALADMLRGVTVTYNMEVDPRTSSYILSADISYKGKQLGGVSTRLDRHLITTTYK